MSLTQIKYFGFELSGVTSRQCDVMVC